MLQHCESEELRCVISFFKQSQVRPTVAPEGPEIVARGKRAERAQPRVSGTRDCAPAVGATGLPNHHSLVEFGSSGAGSFPPLTRGCASLTPGYYLSLLWSGQTCLLRGSCHAGAWRSQGCRLLLSPAVLLIAALAPAADPGYGFLSEKRRYLNPDAPTSVTLTLDQVRMLASSGWEGPMCDTDLGIDYLRRISEVSIVPAAEGNLQLNEEVLLTGGMNGRVARLRPVSIPIATDPHQSANLIRARHPLAEVLPELQEILKIDNPIQPVAAGPAMREVIMGTWVLKMHYDRETHQLSDVAQYDRKTGILVKKSVYAKWFVSPSGQRLPGEVTVRTYTGDERKPVVEVRYSGIEEVSPDGARPNPTVSADIHAK